MAEVKHLVVVKFKEGVVVQDIITGMEKLASDIDAVKSFEWGQAMESPEMLRQGFAHAFLFTFSNKDAYAAYVSHPSHDEFTATFKSVIEILCHSISQLFLSNRASSSMRSRLRL